MTSDPGSEYIEQDRWKEIRLTTEWGHEKFWACPKCGCVVKDKDLHGQKCN